MPWELRVLQQRLDRLRDPVDAWAPAIDVYETDDTFVVMAEVPGMRRDQIELVFDDTRLTIRGHRPDRLANCDIVHFHQIERGYGTFVRTFEFSTRISMERLKAELVEGVLTITLPKEAPPPPRTIQVLEG
jgi:HSP20 family protein